MLFGLRSSFRILQVTIHTCCRSHRRADCNYCCLHQTKGPYSVLTFLENWMPLLLLLGYFVSSDLPDYQFLCFASACER